MRNVFLLTLCQALGLTGAALIAFAGGIVGQQLAPDPIWATLPVALVVVGVAAFSIPASLIMKRYGRRKGFLVGSGLAIFGAAAAAYAISIHQFVLFCLSMLFLGANNAFVQQFRYAAVESVSSKWTGRAVSIILAGGVIGGFLGPEIGERTWNLLSSADYVGSFAALVIIYILLFLLQTAIRDTQIAETTVSGKERPLRDLLHQPVFLVAILAGMTAYGVMSFLMTATPISMHIIDGHSLDSTSLVIQSHIVAMYLPSFFTGLLLTRFGISKVMGVGVVSMLACLAVAAASHDVFNYWSSLVLLGLGWNFLFVGGTVLLTHSYRPAERFKAQAVNDFSVFSMQAFASLIAGAVITTTSWRIMAAINLPILLLMSAATILLHRTLIQHPERLRADAVEVYSK
ncbi:MAG: MFS transporter [Chloroflexi bacterium]|nr:MAG: MFS transporter [Chloroflexota bacterium]